MLILGTGKNSKGYTLLEILAVITLIGLMAAIVFPAYTLREEKTVVKYIGNLVESDFKSLQEEALCTQSELTVEFSAQGYQFALGETAIVRHFSQYQFGFKLPEAAHDDSEPGNDTTVLENTDSSDSEPELTVPELQFTKEGLSTGLTLQWQTTHFSGTMTVDSDGVSKWNFEPKK